MNSTSFEESLVNVRKAYRLLHDYQRCSMDIVCYISAQLGFLESFGGPAFSSRPGRDKINLKSWAWDWLGMFYFDFYFTRRDDDLKLSIQLISDSGFYISNHPTPKETDITTFAPAEDSQTKLGFLVYRQWPVELNETMGRREVVRRFIEQNGELPRELRQAGIVGKCCDFARCHDRRSTDAVIDELVALARKHKLPLERIKKAA